MKTIEGGVRAPKGFRANAVSCGIKKSKPDLGLIYSESPAVTCGLFTQNRVQAAPIKLNKQHLLKITAHAVVINSGNANSCTGKQGEEAALATARAVAKGLNLETTDVLVASTGIIGEQLPVDKIKSAVPSLIKGLSETGSRKVAQAILTTDKVVKEMALEVKLKKKTIKIGAIAKGAGMLNPCMATMLCFITTDAYITRRALKIALKEAVKKSFNAISVDGDTSTNDTVLAMANASIGGDLIDKNKEDFEKFKSALEYLTAKLAEKMVRDGEGANKFVEVVVKGASPASGAKRVAQKVVNSILFKTALFGQDPNWGRIAAAAGSSGVKFHADKLDIYLGSKKVLKDGAALKVDEKILKDMFKKKDIGITIDLKSGNKTYRALTTDLSYDYVKINAYYRT